MHTGTGMGFEKDPRPLIRWSLRRIQINQRRVIYRDERQNEISNTHALGHQYKVREIQNRELKLRYILDPFPEEAHCPTTYLLRYIYTTFLTRLYINRKFNRTLSLPRPFTARLISIGWDDIDRRLYFDEDAPYK